MPAPRPAKSSAKRAKAPQPTRGSNKRTGTSSSNGPKSFHNLFVACLPRCLTNAEFNDLFRPYNALTATIMMDAATGKSKGFGFVSFATEEDGQRAVDALNGVPITINENTFSMHLSPSCHDLVEESCFVYFRNIPSVLGADTTRAVFSHYGKVISIQMRSDLEKKDTVEMLLVMVEYSTVEEARLAIKECHGDVLFPQISPTPVMAKFAEPAVVAKLQVTTTRRQPLPKTLPIAIRRQTCVDVEYCHSDPASLASASCGQSHNNSNLDYAEEDDDCTSVGCSLQSIPVGSIYRHDPYSHHGYAVSS